MPVTPALERARASSVTQETKGQPGLHERDPASKNKQTKPNQTRMDGLVETEKVRVMYLEIPTDR